MISASGRNRASLSGETLRYHPIIMRRVAIAALVFWPLLRAAEYPAPAEGDYVARNYTFTTGESLPEVRIHYWTLGKPVKDAGGQVLNAVLIMHGTGGTGHGFLTPTFAGELFGAGQLLDATKYFIILADDVGHGQSSKPSDGMHLRFPRYTYEDMVRLEHLLVTEKLGVNHLRLVMGTSMGAMHTWMWGYMYPQFMDALMPLASAPVEIGGRNRMLRKMVIDSIRKDPEFKNGEYKGPLKGMLGAQFALFMMTSSPLQLLKQAPTREEADKAFEKRFYEGAAVTTDPNNMLYAYECSRDYNPAPHLEEIQAPLYAINSADDQVNPPELGILEREIKRVKHGRYILIPISDETRGHGTHSLPRIWGNYLAELLQESEHRPAGASAALLNPSDPLWKKEAPSKYRVRIQSTKGDIVLEVDRALAPKGADRFYHLVETGFYDNSRFYRVIAGRFAQFGIAGYPKVAQIWRNQSITDDPVKASNVRGTFAYAMTGPDARTTQIYINTGDQTNQDATGFAPFGKVVEGMDVVDRLYAGYAERSGGGMRAGKQGKLFEEGNAYLDREFPELDRLQRATLE
jgi:homoserine O-acetyltransferase